MTRDHLPGAALGDVLVASAIFGEWQYRGVRVEERCVFDGVAGTLQRRMVRSVEHTTPASFVTVSLAVRNGSTRHVEHGRGPAAAALYQRARRISTRCGLPLLDHVRHDRR